MLNNFIKFAAVGALIFAVPSAHAAVTITSGATPGTTSATFTPTFGMGINNTAVINFNGFNDAGGTPVSTLMAKLSLTLVSVVGNNYNFSYILANTSGDDIDASRITVFGFNSAPPLAGATVDNTDQFNLLIRDGSSNANGGDTLAFCLKDSGNPNNCNSGSNGVSKNGSATGEFTLTYASPSPTSITLDGFRVRYQGIDSRDLGLSGDSASGVPFGLVPEPATWAMMILGFGLIGGALRSRKAQVARVTYA